MKNYIPENFYEIENKIVYTKKDKCINIHGTAIEFDPEKTKLLISKVENGMLIPDSTKQANADKTRSEEELYAGMVKDVYNQMESVFGTRNDVSAAAFAATWEAMEKRPANYVSAELGLANEAAVTAYAAQKIAESDAYGVYRLKRIAQYQSDKANL